MTRHIITLLIVDWVCEYCSDLKVLHNKTVIIKSNLFSIIFIMYITAQIPEINSLNLLSHNLKRDELLTHFQ